MADMLQYLEMLLERPLEGKSVQDFYEGYMKANYYGRYFSEQDKLELTKRKIPLAISYIQKYTFYRVKPGTIEDSSVELYSLLDCICELSEYMAYSTYIRDELQKNLVIDSAALSQTITSESIDGASITRVNPMDIIKQAAPNQRELQNDSAYYEIIERYLADTGLMYRGFD